MLEVIGLKKSFGDIEVLKNIDFKVDKGEVIAVLGPSGSGKSTVVNLIPRLYDVNAGSVSVAGVDVRDFDLKHLRENIGVVTQDTYLFNGTIRENLLYAKDDATQEEMENACRIASIHDMIIAQPDGYDTVVGNRGLKLSGGEKQRISIARVILKDPSILILDEATSALDSISENAIQDALEAMMEGRTSIVIAHRLSTILKADSILVVNNGVIEEQGSHEELIERDGTYRKLYETQFKQAVNEEGKPGFNLESLSSEYDVRRLTESDITDIYNLCKWNTRYYNRIKEQPSRRNLTSVISDPKEGDEKAGKLVAGFYEGDKLVAFMDLVLGYPEEGDAFIGWLMVDIDEQGKGVGSQIVADVRATLKAQGYKRISLGCYEENEPAIEFWKSQGFSMTGETMEQNGRQTLIMERSI